MWLVSKQFKKRNIILLICLSIAILIFSSFMMACSMDPAGAEDRVSLKFTVTYVTDTTLGTVVDSNKYSPGEKVNLPSNLQNLSNQNKEFLGWYLYNQQWFFNSSLMPAKNITLQARWGDVGYYYVTYDRGHNSALIKKQFKVGLYIDNPQNMNIDLDYPGYTLNGWWCDQIQVNWDFNRNYMLNQDITLKANWQVKSYVVKFYSNGEDVTSGVPFSEESVNFGQTISQPSQGNPTKIGANFKCWFDEDESDPQYYGEWDFTKGLKMPAHDINLIAYWNYIEYKVTYDLDGGNLRNGVSGTYTDPITYEFGQIVREAQEAKSPIRSGYNFNGYKLYNSDQSLSDFIFDKDTMPNNNITLKAQWSINSYTVTFDENGGQNVSGNLRIKKIPGDKIQQNEFPKAERVNNKSATISGWYYADNNQMIQWNYNDSVMLNHDITLVAYWSAYYLEFEAIDNNNISINKDQTIGLDDNYAVISGDLLSKYIDTTKIALKATENSHIDYVFSYFYDKKDSTKAHIDLTKYNIPQCDLNLVAVFVYELPTYIITLDYNGGKDSNNQTSSTVDVKKNNELIINVQTLNNISRDDKNDKAQNKWFYITTNENGMEIDKIWTPSKFDGSLADSNKKFTLYLCWDYYNISFLSVYDDATNMPSKTTFKDSTEITKPQNDPQSKEGGFSGWYLSKDGSIINLETNQFFENNNRLFYRDVVLVAKFDNKLRYIVTYDFNGGKDKNNKTFFEEEYDKGANVINPYTTLMSSNYLVKKIINNNSIPSNGQWYYFEGGECLPYNFTSSNILTGNLRLYLGWEEYTVNWYYIKTDTNILKYDGLNDLSTNQKIIYNDNDSLRDDIISTNSLHGYNYYSWAININSPTSMQNTIITKDELNNNEFINAQNINVHIDMNLYACYEKVGEVWVRYDLNSGSGTKFNDIYGNFSKDIRYNIGDKIKYIGHPWSEENNFSGWAYGNRNTLWNFNDILSSEIVNNNSITTSDGKKIFKLIALAGASKLVTHVVTLKILSPDQLSNLQNNNINDSNYKVFMRLNVLDSFRVPLEDILHPYAEGYIFKNWFTDVKCSVVWKLTNLVTKDLTLYGCFDLRSDSQYVYKVKFEDSETFKYTYNNSSVDASPIYNYYKGSPIYNPCVGVHGGQILKWKINGSFEEFKFDSMTIPVTDTRTEIVFTRYANGKDAYLEGQWLDGMDNNKFYYVTYSDQVVVTKFQEFKNQSDNNSIEVPSMIGGLPVTRIGLKSYIKTYRKNSSGNKVPAVMPFSASNTTDNDNNPCSTFLKSVDLSKLDYLVQINDNAFAVCTYLDTVIFPKHNYSIGQCAFEGSYGNIKDSRAATVDLSNCSYVSNRAFCLALFTNAVLPKGDFTFGEYAFANLEHLSTSISLELGNALYVGSYCFHAASNSSTKINPQGSSAFTDYWPKDWNS